MSCRLCSATLIPFLYCTFPGSATHYYHIPKGPEWAVTRDHWPGTVRKEKIGRGDEGGQIHYDSFEVIYSISCYFHSLYILKLRLHTLLSALGHSIYYFHADLDGLYCIRIKSPSRLYLGLWAIKKWKCVFERQTKNLLTVVNVRGDEFNFPWPRRTMEWEMWLF